MSAGRAGAGAVAVGDGDRADPRPPGHAGPGRQSMVGQSYPGELECVIVFDQSRPAPVDVELPAGRRVRLLTNTRTPGAAGARNTGIAASDGAVVAFCDDDDTWHADKLRLQVERLDAAPAGFVACGMRIHYADRVVARPCQLGRPCSSSSASGSPELVFPTFAVRRDALADIGLLDEQIPGSYGEDYDFSPAGRAARADRRGRAAARRCVLAPAVVLRPALADDR